MKQLMEFIRSPFKKRKSLSSVMSEAVAEGIRDTMIEMGYRFEVKKKDTGKNSGNDRLS